MGSFFFEKIRKKPEVKGLREQQRKSEGRKKSPIAQLVRALH